MKSKGLFQPLVLGTVLALGFLAVWGVVGFVALENGYMIATRNEATEELIIREDGTASIAHEEQGVTSHRDLGGWAPVAVAEDDPIFRLNGQQLVPSLPFRPEDREWDNRVRSFTDGQTPRTAWYFIADGRPDGTAYFVGYDIYSKAKIGYLGTGGYRAEMPPPKERFPAGVANRSRLQEISPGHDHPTRRGLANPPGLSARGQGAAMPCLVYILGVDSKIYEADLRKRTVRVVVQESGIRSFAIPYLRKSPDHIDWQLAVRTDRDVVVVDKHGREQQRYRIPREMCEQPFIFGETTAGEAVMYWNKEQSVIDREDEYQLFWVRPDGRSRTAALTLPGRPVLGLRYVFAALLPSPLALEVLGVIRSRELQESMEPTFSSALARTLSEFWPSLAIAQLMAVGLAVLCQRRQARYGTRLAERLVWPLFVLLLGLPGWIGYRFGRKWPVLESCPDCGVAVPRNRPSCLRCTLDFPRPALKGTEVFA